jgi:hypothetical protein
MAWTPTIKVFDETPIKNNLIGYIQANQVEALKWANAGVALPSISTFHRSNRLVTQFPALTFLQTSHDASYGEGGILMIDFEANMELAIIHGNMDTAADRVVRYAMALESMLANLPETTFRQGSILQITSTAMRFRITHAEQGKYKNKYIQVFQARAAWEIEAAMTD